MISRSLSKSRILYLNSILRFLVLSKSTYFKSIFPNRVITVSLINFFIFQPQQKILVISVLWRFSCPVLKDTIFSKAYIPHWSEWDICKFVISSGKLSGSSSFSIHFSFRYHIFSIFFFFKTDQRVLLFSKVEFPILLWKDFILNLSILFNFCQGFLL